MKLVPWQIPFQGIRKLISSNSAASKEGLREQFFANLLLTSALDTLKRNSSELVVVRPETPENVFRKTNKKACVFFLQVFIDRLPDCRRPGPEVRNGRDGGQGRWGRSCQRWVWDLRRCGGYPNFWSNGSQRRFAERNLRLRVRETLSHSAESNQASSQGKGCHCPGTIWNG